MALRHSTGKLQVDAVGMFFLKVNNYFQVVIVIFTPIYHSCLVVSTLCLVPHLPQGCPDLVLTLLGLYQT